jgi:hypothetical protein
MRVGIYARVSTVDQCCEMQLREYAARRGWIITREYVDSGWSGAKAGQSWMCSCEMPAGAARMTTSPATNSF